MQVRRQDGESAAALDDPPVTYEPSWIDERGEYHLDTFSSQDGMAWETQGHIFDRSREHLGASDQGISLLRQMLFDAIAAVQKGEDPRGIVRDPTKNAAIDLEGWLAERDYAAMTMDSELVLTRKKKDDVFDARHSIVDIPPGIPRMGV